MITVRGMHALQNADVILADHLGPTAELNKLCDVDSKEIIDVSKLPYKKSVSQDRINELLISHAHAGKKVARLKGGDPFVFGRGFEEVQALAEAGIATEVIPGVTSAVSVPASAACASYPARYRACVYGCVRAFASRTRKEPGGLGSIGALRCDLERDHGCSQCGCHRGCTTRRWPRRDNAGCHY